MKYDVTLYGPKGLEVVTVEAEGGDDAATRAHRAGCVIRAIVPSETVDEDPAPKRGRPAKAQDA